MEGAGDAPLPWSCMAILLARELHVWCMGEVMAGLELAAKGGDNHDGFMFGGCIMMSTGKRLARGEPGRWQKTLSCEV